MDDIFRLCSSHALSREHALVLTQGVFHDAWDHVAGGNDIDDVQAFLRNIAQEKLQVKRATAPLSYQAAWYRAIHRR